MVGRSSGVVPPFLAPGRAITPTYQTPLVIQPRLLKFHTFPWLFGYHICEKPQAPLPCGFSQISQKRWHGAPPFWNILSYIVSAHVVNISDQSHSRSGHQITSSDLTSVKTATPALAALSDRSLSNFQELIKATACTKFVSRRFDVGDQSSGQFHALSHYQWERAQSQW